MLQINLEKKYFKINLSSNIKKPVWYAAFC